MQPIRIPENTINVMNLILCYAVGHHVMDYRIYRIHLFCKTRVQWYSGHRSWYWIRPPGFESLHRASPSLHPFGVVHWVPEQLNIKAVTGACKFIDGCSLELCSATPSVAYHLAFATEIKSIKLPWLWWPRHEIVPVTLHCVALPLRYVKPTLRHVTLRYIT